MTLAITSPSATQVWTSLKQWLPARNPDSDYWWDLTGAHLATMLDAAGYTVQKQYDALLFHYHWIVSQETVFFEAIN
jgi:hypothetical protein